MRILIVAATVFEIKPLLDGAGLEQGRNKVFTIHTEEHCINLLLTGIGPIFTAFELSRHLGSSSYDLVVNIGICGAFSQQFKIGEVLEITQDQFGDLGIDDKGSFRSLFDMGFMDESVHPFKKGQLHSSAQFATGLTKANAITVSTTCGSEERIEWAKRQYSSDTESMEGAACFYVCHQMGLPCIQLRAISNYVEPRDPSQWDIPLAVRNLNQYIGAWLGLKLH